MQTVTLKDKSFALNISSDEIQKTVDRLAAELNRDVKDSVPLFLVILNGSFMFAADLLKKIEFPCEISFVKLSSYSGDHTTGNVKKLIGLNEVLKGRDVIILEDIIDSGITMSHMFEQLECLSPASVKIVSFLFKPQAFQKDFKIDYIGISIPNDFIVGYGLDYDGLGRNLKDIYKVID
jgi:hypoxanthine phosphoribosyltransferase